VADLELWVHDVRVHGYADDFSTSYSAHSEEEIIAKLEEDAERILKFMASNYLNTNAKKTGFMIIRTKENQSQREVRIGSERVIEAENHRILGLVVDNKLTWKDHVYGGLLQDVRRRVGALRRISYQVPRSYLPSIASAIIGSKVRYGISMYCPVRMMEDDPTPSAMKDIQVVLNNAMRIATGWKIKDRVPIVELVRSTNIPTVNHMSAQSKLSLAWHAVKNEKHPLNDVFTNESTCPFVSSRGRSRGDLRTSAKSTLGQRNFPEPSIRLWNKTPETLRAAGSNGIFKSEARNFISSLPL